MDSAPQGLLEAPEEPRGADESQGPIKTQQSQDLRTHVLKCIFYSCIDLSRLKIKKNALSKERYPQCTFKQNGILAVVRSLGNQHTDDAAAGFLGVVKRR